MNAEKRIYFMKPKRNTQQFIGGFKNDSCLEIIDGILNPDLINDQQRSAYYISLEQRNDTPRDIFICDQNCEVQKTKNEEYNICFYGGPDRQHGLLISKVFADTEEEALRKVIEIRNEAIVTGEWDLAWERHLLQQSKFNRKVNGN